MAKMLPPYNPEPSPLDFGLLPKMAKTRRGRSRTLVLDLDETLVHCEPQPFIGCHEAIFLKSPDGTEQMIYMSYRPQVKNFLALMSSHFEIVVFTASKSDYANAVIDKLDPDRSLIKHRLYREHCLDLGNVFVKDLSKLGRDLSQVVIVDNSILSFGYHLSNGILIPSYFGQNFDTELDILGNILSQIVSQDIDDVRGWLASKF